MKKNNGFTLVEVMVAVGVIAIALPSLLFTMQSQVQGAAYLRDKLQAQWVAENKLAEFHIENKASGSVIKGKQKGTEQLGVRIWHWETESKQFLNEQFKDMYAVRVSVWDESFEKGDDPLVSVYSAFREYDFSASSKPIPAAEPPIYQESKSNQDEQ